MDLNSVKENENLKNLDDDEIDNAIDLIFPAYHTIDEKDFYKATSDLSKYLNNKLSDESKEKIADILIELFDDILDDPDAFKKILVNSHSTKIKTGGLNSFCSLLSYEYTQIDDFREKLTSICGANSEELTHLSIYDFYSDKDHYRQQNKKIYKIIKTKDGTIDEIPVAVFSVNKLTRHQDFLEISEPLYTFEYYDGYDNELKVIEKSTYAQIAKELYNKDLFNTTEAEAEKIFRIIRHTLHNDCLMEKRQTLLYTGFFIDNDGKLISNTNIDGSTTSKIYLKEAMLLLIEVLESNPNSQYKNSALIRKLISMAFHYCLKQLGFAEGNTNGGIFYGEARTGKTTMCKIAKWIYLEEPYNYNASTDTLASLVRTLSTTTFFSLFDDSYELLSNPAVQNTIKKGMYEKYSRTVADRDSRGDVLEYRALSTPVFTYNENVPIIDDGLERRLDKIHYDKNDEVNSEEGTAFKMKFNPTNKNSVLEKLHHIGIAYRDWITPYLESNAKELNDIDSLTVQFFSETLDELGLEYAPLTTKYEYETNVEDYRGIIRNEFNKKLLRSKLVYTNGVHTANLITVAKSGYFSWLKYQPKNERFVISAKDFVSACNKITNHSWNFEDLMSELDIVDYKIKQIKVGGTTIANATFIGIKDLAQNILNINSLIDDDMEDYE